MLLIDREETCLPAGEHGHPARVGFWKRAGRSFSLYFLLDHVQKDGRHVAVSMLDRKLNSKFGRSNGRG
jgi:hypothetical protein